MFGLGLQMKAPIEDVLPGIGKLEKSCEKVLRALGPKEPADGIAWSLKSIRQHLRSVRRESRVVNTELRRWRRGRLSSIDLLIDDSRMLAGSLRALDRKMHPRMRGSFVDRARRDVNTTYKAAIRLVDWATKQKARLDGGHGRLEQILRIARFADPKGTRRLSRESLARWLSSYDIPEWEEEVELTRLAKLFAACSYPWQEWMICWRSEAPGRPLRSLPVDSCFPREELVRDLEDRFGRQEEYFIAARRPHWRIVWRSSWNQDF